MKKAIVPQKRERPILLLLAGILLIGLGMIIEALRTASQTGVREKPTLGIAFLWSVLFTGGLILIIWSLAIFHKRGYKLPEVLLGIALTAVGVFFCVFTIAHIKDIVGATKGSAIFLGPVGLPTVVFVLVIPLIGILCSIFGIMVFLRAVSPRIRRKLG